MATAEISAKDVMKLRNQTGAGMMDCKKALAEADGNFEVAIDILRKQGQKLANKRADREATEGFVLAKSSADNKKAFIIVLNCETDFVAKNENFGKLVNQFADAALAANATTLEQVKALPFENITIGEKVIEQVGVIGEKLELSYFEAVQGEQVYSYNHPGNRTASILAVNAAVDVEVVKNVAMQIAAMNPVSIDKADCPQSVIEKEIEIAKELLRQEGKPEDMIDKIAQGKLTRFFKDSTLLNQDFIKDNKQTVGQYLKSFNKDLTVTAFKRYSLAD
ncbi:MAG: translation elongation factor Ts [Flavobacteriales bacterium]